MKKFDRALLMSFAIRCCGLVLLCTLTSAAQTQSYTTLFEFDGKNGDQPYLPILQQGIDGNLYGTTSMGGKGYCGGYGCGTVFKVTPEGKLTTLHDFCADNNCADGYNPSGGVAVGPDGNLYGMTVFGGTSFGTVYKVTPSGTFTTIHTFHGSSDGFTPYDALTLATDSNFYGTTQYGGANLVGNVFKMTPAGVVTNLHSFNCTTDGAYPYAGVIQATDGNFYGTTYSCGGNDAYGTIYRITPSGVLTTLHVFHETDGKAPVSGVIEGPDGNFYGSSAGGGLYDFGTIFKMTPQGSFTVLYNCNLNDCYGPGQLLMGTDGNIYGKGAYSVFKMTTGGALTILYLDEDSYSYTGPSEGTDGNLYGTTAYSNEDRNGTIWRYETSLTPFVETVPAGGAAGVRVRILGTNLTGATAVTFNGVPAKFTVAAATEIVTSVPAGATTGAVQVTTPSGTLVSNVAFQVVP